MARPPLVAQRANFPEEPLALREWLPILDNSQDLVRLADVVESILAAHPCTHGFLLCGHGLYTWGDSLTQAKRHVEILEFLLEVVGRKGFGMRQR